MNRILHSLGFHRLDHYFCISDYTAADGKHVRFCMDRCYGCDRKHLNAHHPEHQWVRYEDIPG